MAQAPQRPQRPPPPQTQTYAQPEPDPGDSEVRTVQQEQLDRSAEIEEMGVEPWKAQNDQRRGRQRQVQGIGRDDDSEYPGTPTTPPEGHDERQPGVGEPGGPTAGHYPMPGEPGGEVEAEPDDNRRLGQRQSRR
jgi:hypothetical protein